MKITILGSCRQSSINELYNITDIQEKISYPHYTKEILQVINFCKYGNLTPDETLYTFRTAIIENKPIYFNDTLQNNLENSDIYIIEIASKLSYKYNNIYVHHIATEESYNVSIKNDINIINQTRDEIEDDIFNIKNILNKPIIIVSHLVTRDYGERYILKCWLEEICLKYNILFIDPIKELTLKNYNINDLFLEKDNLQHYNENGHKIIKEIYNEYIKKIL